MAVDVDAAVAALDELMLALDAATKDGVDEGAKLVQSIGRANAPHLSGELAASIEILGPSPTGAATYAAKVGPTLVYGRIREIGGPIPGERTVMTHPYLRWFWMGRPVFKHKVYQKGSHYFLKTVVEVRPQFKGICARHWADAIREV